MKRVLLAYGGLVKSEDRLLHAYFQLQNGRIDAEAAQVFAEPLSDCAVGDVFEYRCSDDGAVVHKPGKRTSLKAPPELVSSWRASHLAIEASEKSWTKPLDPSLEVLQPVRLAYRRLPEEQRAVLIAQVVRFIVEG